MNFVLKSAYAPIGCRPIHHWTMSRLLREFGVAAFEPPKPKQEMPFDVIAARCGVVPKTVMSWRYKRVPQRISKSRKKLEIYRKVINESYVNDYSSKRRKYSLWDLWDRVKERWRQLSRMLHPDTNRKSHTEFATMCRIYLTLKERFRKRGIA